MEKLDTVEQIFCRNRFIVPTRFDQKKSPHKNLSRLDHSKWSYEKSVNHIELKFWI